MVPGSWNSRRGTLTSSSQGSGAQKASARASLEELFSWPSELSVSSAEILRTRTRGNHPKFWQEGERCFSGPTTSWWTTPAQQRLTAGERKIIMLWGCGHWRPVMPQGMAPNPGTWTILCSVSLSWSGDVKDGYDPISLYMSMKFSKMKRNGFLKKRHKMIMKQGSCFSWYKTVSYP